MMMEEFIVWFLRKVTDITETMKNALINGACILVAVITVPVWGIPFLIWYFTKWKKDVSEFKKIGPDEAKKEMCRRAIQASACPNDCEVCAWSVKEDVENE